MHGLRVALLLIAVSGGGCADGRFSLADRRPPTTPVPFDVQQEIRDARSFLALPDRSIGPMPTFNPEFGQAPPSSR